jgi:hypothetical protein
MLSINKLKQLNDFALKRFADYQGLEIQGKRVSTPYFINNTGMWFIKLMIDEGVEPDKIGKIKKAFVERKIPYGWYLGKGEPEEITEAVKKISEISGLSLKKSSNETILEFMKLYGLGVDCSGLVYNLLAYGLSKLRESDLLNESLDWSDSSFKGVTRAGAFSFAGKASTVIKPEDVIMLDVILIRGTVGGGVNHIALVLEKNDSLMVAQSTIKKVPTGVSIDKLNITNNSPVFGFKPSMGLSWEKMFEDGRLEFRRLNCFRDLKDL